MFKKKNKYNVAVMGATGAVGRCFLSILSERKFPIDELRLLASERSQNKKVIFNGKEISVQVLNQNSFSGIDIVLASAGAARSKEFLPYAAKAGAVCIDNSSAFRMDRDVPLVVPEVNPHVIKENKGIIANPNCSTIQMVVPLKAIHKVAGIKRVVVSTYQSVSGAGQNNIQEMENETKSLSAKASHYEIGKHCVAKEEIKYFNYQIAYNLIPRIDVFTENGYTKEEIKMINETRKIMEIPNLKITATCVRVPVFYCHSESVNIETEKKLKREDVISILKNTQGVVVVDDIALDRYPMPLDIEGKDEVFVGRIREDESVDNGINLWVVADNLRKGAALNAVQIAEYMIK
ncbi:aspartate-semialdehyde dehydrogenase [Candidatus Omnitrophus magneticus]|uniref:Aspartate-semialdehyde dehydrogenase n=1 Tax=Candidatus Omnitrophus magneticus TaxID=1609969 RepID=A0A0F0CNY7_9BACT|nr:aspartate-semialdehyde dehydrogenase [Candidatus Omnitrophus magneticus]